MISEAYTYSMNSARHNSSFLVKACSARHVPPSLKRLDASKDSRTCTRISSGRAANAPRESLRFTADVNALPEGRRPRGCLLTREPSSVLLTWASTA